MDATQGVDDALAALAATLPRDAAFEWQTDEEGVHLALFTIPRGARGIGTAFLARALAECDRRGVSVALAADPSDEPGETHTFHLVRWYRRFGFTLTGTSPEGWMEMHRAPRPWRGEEAVLRDYAAAKLRNDLTADEWDGILASLGAEGTTAPRRGVAPSP